MYPSNSGEQVPKVIVSNKTLDTRHLDTAIAIFKGKPSAKRAPKNRVFYVIEMDPEVYAITHNGRTLEDGLTKGQAILNAQERAQKATALTGKSHDYNVIE